MRKESFFIEYESCSFEKYQKWGTSRSSFFRCICWCLYHTNGCLFMSELRYFCVSFQKKYYSFFTSRCSTSKTLTRLKSWRIKIFCFWPQEKLDTNNLVNGFVFDVLMMNFPISCWKFDIFRNPVELLSKRTLFVQK